MGSATARRYARHRMLPGVGEEGQRKLEGAHVEVRGEGLEGWIARRYLEAGGVGEVKAAGGMLETPSWVNGALVTGAGREVTAGALEALRLLREALEKP